MHLHTPIEQLANTLHKTRTQEVKRPKVEDLIHRQGNRRIIHRHTQRSKNRLLRQIAMQMRQRERVRVWVGNVIAANICVSHALLGCGDEILVEFQTGFGSFDAVVEGGAARLESVLVAA